MSQHPNSTKPLCTWCKGTGEEPEPEKNRVEELQNVLRQLIEKEYYTGQMDLARVALGLQPKVTHESTPHLY